MNKQKEQKERDYQKPTIKETITRYKILPKVNIQ